MHKTTQKIVYTALFIAFLLAFQALSKSFGQIVTGSLVNFTLICATLISGFASGAIAAVVSPAFAFLLGIGPQFPLLLPVIALGNLVICAVFALVFRLLRDKNGAFYFSARYVVSILFGAGLKFVVLYFGIVKLLVPVLVGSMPAVQGQKVAATLTLSFGVTQLFTALIGGALAFAVVPVLRRVLSKTAPKKAH